MKEQWKMIDLTSNELENPWNFSTVTVEKFKFSEFLLGDKNATYLSSKTISTLPFTLLI